MKNNVEQPIKHTRDDFLVNEKPKTSYSTKELKDLEKVLSNYCRDNLETNLISEHLKYKSKIYGISSFLFLCAGISLIAMNIYLDISKKINNKIFAIMGVLAIMLMVLMAIFVYKFINVYFTYDHIASWNNKGGKYNDYEISLENYNSSYFKATITYKSPSIIHNGGYNYTVDPERNTTTRCSTLIDKAKLINTIFNTKKDLESSTITSSSSKTYNNPNSQFYP